MTRADVRAAAPWIVIATAVVSVIAFGATLLGVNMSGPGKQLNAQSARIVAVEDSLRVVRAEQAMASQIVAGLGRLACRQSPADATLAGLPCGTYLMQRLGVRPGP